MKSKSFTFAADNIQDDCEIVDQIIDSPRHYLSAALIKDIQTHPKGVLTITLSGIPIAKIFTETLKLS